MASNALTGQACARLDLDLAGPIGTVGFRAEDITAPDSLGSYPGWFVSVPAGLTSAIASNVLNWAFLFKVLPELTTKLEVMLAQGGEDVSVPGLGDALDAGADVVGVLNTQVITPLSDIASVVTGVTALDVENQIENRNPHPDASCSTGPATTWWMRPMSTSWPAAAALTALTAIP